MSRDAAQRCNIIKLARPRQAGGAWDDAVDRFIREYRWQIIADVAAEFERPHHAVVTGSRWGLFEREIVGRLDNPRQIMAELALRAEDVNDDESERQLVRDGIIQAIRAHGINPDNVLVHFRAQELAQILQTATGESRPTNRASTYINTLAITELSRVRTSGARLYRWTGANAPAGSRPVNLQQFGR